MDQSGLDWLMQWYLSQCDERWEHVYGIKIDTLDNPGWALTIDLRETSLENQPFKRVEHGEPSVDLEDWRQKGSWWVAKVEGACFEAACGPLDLHSVISLFRQWTEASRT